MSQAVKFQSSIPAGTFVETLTGNTGGPVGPNGSSNINILGTGVVSVAGNPGTNTLTISSTANAGIVTINGDTGSVTGTTVSLINGAQQGTFKFSGSGTTMTQTVADARGNMVIMAGDPSSVLPSGSGNTIFGYLAFGSGNATSANFNTGFGYSPFPDITTGRSNAGFGQQPLVFLTSGSYNLCLAGYQGGVNYTSSESSNISLNASTTTVTGESNTLRIGDGTGTGTQQLKASYISGINGVNLSTANVVTESSDQLGTAVITAGTNVTLDTSMANKIIINSVGGGVPGTIVLMGDSGGALTSGSFTFTGGSTGLTFAGSGSTLTLGGDLVVANGGTGAVTLGANGVLIGNGTSAITATTAGTNGQVLLGTTSAAPTFITPTAGTGLAVTTNATTLSYALSTPVSIANGGTNATSMTNTDGVVYFDGTKLNTTTVGTAGYALTSNGAAMAPTFQALPATSISITGDTGGALTGAAFTFTGGTTGLKFGGSSSTETLSGTLAIANGGTNATSMTTTDGVIYFDGTKLSTTNVGTTNQILFSNGAGVAPSFKTATVAGVVTQLSGDSGSATPNSGIITVTGGSTGFIFTGSGSTLTASFPAAGTFTPSLFFGAGNTGITYSVQSGVYTIIGNTVTFTITLVLTSKGSSTGLARVVGLPYPIANLTYFTCGTSSVTFTGYVVAAMDVTATPPQPSSLDIIDVRSAAGENQLSNTAFTNSSALYISGAYII